MLISIRPAARPRTIALLLSLSLVACGDEKGGDEGASEPSDGDAADGEVSTDPTWHGDVRPILHARCGSCHVSDGIAPFDLASYETAAPLADAILSSVEHGTMPPWLAQETDECSPRLPWKGDMRLSDSEKATLRAWVEAGAPEGDASSPAPLEEPPALELAAPDAQLEFSEPYRIEGEEDDFQCFVLDPGNTEDVWVTGVQVLPGNPKVDHHALVFMDVDGVLADGDKRFPCFNTPDVDGFLMATWTPGAAPMRTPESTGMPLPAGARIVVQMHYHPDPTTPEFDQTVVQLEWAEEQPAWDAAQALIGNNHRQSSDGTGLQPGMNDSGEDAEFIIPAGAEDHVETIVYTQSVPIDFPLFSVGTHMHYVGTDMKIDFVDVDEDTGTEDEQCLIQTPAWDFNWQRVYDFDAPVDELPVISEGDSLVLRCTYDNSLGNPFVVDALAERGIDAPEDVYLGDETLDEMCLGLFGILVPPGLIDQLY